MDSIARGPGGKRTDPSVNSMLEELQHTMGSMIYGLKGEGGRAYSSYARSCNGEELH